MDEIKSFLFKKYNTLYDGNNVSRETLFFSIFIS